jgi:diguanylate cyclase (GGDEF)-like protein/PAS domain S-box-containing protein
MDAEIYRTILDNLEIGVCLVDHTHRIVFWNHGAEKITGYQCHDVIGHRSRDNILAQCNDVSCGLCGASCPINDAMLNGKHREIQTQLHHKSGHRIPVLLRVTAVRDNRGAVACASASFVEDHDVSGLELHSMNLASHGCLDVLTGVPNHVFTQSHLRENLFFFQEHALPFGLLRIKLDQLETLQTTHGREAADVILHVVAQTMKHVLRPDGFLGRWSPDEFMAILTYCDNQDLNQAAEKVQRMVGCSGVQWWDDMLSVTISVSQTMVRPGDTLESLLERTHKSPPEGSPEVGKAASAGEATS